MLRNRKLLVTAWLLAVLILPAVSRADLGYRGWGVRAGLGDDPDQAIVGAHWDLGTFAENVRFMPNIEGGFGDDHTIVALTLPVHYIFTVSGSARPYAGGGALLAFIDRDKRPRGSEFEIALTLAFGVEWELRSHNHLFLELDASGGDAHDAKLIFGWSWTRRSAVP